MTGLNLQKKWLKQLALAAAGLLFLTCSTEHNVNTSNLVTVHGNVYFSRLQKVGVADVTVVIEKSEESASDNIIPDIFVRTDENGRWEARFSLSYQELGDVTNITPAYIEESMRILMISPESKMLDLGSGFTFQGGKTYPIWDVFLEDFAAASDTTGS